MAFFSPSSAADAKATGHVIVGQNLPPVSVGAEDSYYPATLHASLRVHEHAARLGGPFLHFIWCNRSTANANNKPNPFEEKLYVGAYECRVEFTTHAKARAATIVQAMYSMSYTVDEYRAVATAAGFDISDIKTQAGVAAAKDALFVNLPTAPAFHGDYRCANDIIILPTARLTNWAPSQRVGIMLDFEIGDQPTPASTVAFITDLAGKIAAKGYEFWLYTNGLNADSAPNHGFTAANIPTIAGMVTRFCPVLDGISATTFEADIAEQYALAGGSENLAFVIQLSNSGMTPKNARTAYNFMRDRGHPPVFVLWRDGYIQGTDTLDSGNRKIAICAGHDNERHGALLTG